MDFEADKMLRIREFGLSDSSARAYLALLQLGTAEARAVSELANIRAAKVYGTLDQLQERGLAEVALGKPRKYTPVPMEEFIERRMREQREAMAMLGAEREWLFRLCPLRGTTEIAGRPRLVAVTGRRNVLQQIREGCLAAKRDIFVTAMPEIVLEEGPVWRCVEQAVARGVEVHVVHDLTE